MSRSWRTRQGHLGGEGVALDSAWRVLVVVVEPALPHRHHDPVAVVGEGVGQDGLELLQPVRGLVGVEPDGGPGPEVAGQGPARTEPEAPSRTLRTSSTAWREVTASVPTHTTPPTPAAAASDSAASSSVPSGR